MLIILILVVSGCSNGKDNYVRDDGDMVITKIQQLEDGYRYTITDGKCDPEKSYLLRAGWMIDTTIKFNIGDKITISKKDDSCNTSE